MGKEEARIRERVNAFDKLVALRSFFESYNHLAPTDRGLEHRLIRHMERIQNGLERDRKKLENPRRTLFRTRIDNARRLIDEPLSGELEGMLALLHVDTHDEAYRWARNYRGNTAREAQRTLLERHAATAASPAATNSQIHEDSPTYGATYGSVLADCDLERIGVAASKAASVLQASVGASAKELGVTSRTLDALNACFAEACGRPRARAFIPSEDARVGIAGSAAEISAILRGTLSSFLATLSDDQKSVVRRKSEELLIVKGAAGTGKTIVGIHRIRRWIQEPQLFRKPVLFTCYNSVLAHSAAHLLSDAIGHQTTAEFVEVRTAFPLLLEICKELEPRWNPNLVTNKALLPAVKRARQSVRQTNALQSWRDEDILQEILDVIFGRALLRRSQYLDADREGRGVARALNREHDRPAMWRIYQAVRKSWAADAIAPWELVPAHLCGLLQRRPRREPRFYGIVVDEVQDLPPSVIQALELLQGEQRHARMVLLGDAAQSVYRSPFRWKHAGVQAKGHVVILRRCHRSTPSVLRAAVPLIESQRDRFGEDLVIPIAEGADGPVVRLYLAPSDETEADWIAVQVKKHIDDGVNPATIAILSKDRGKRALVRKRLEARGIDVEAYEASKTRKFVNLDHPSVKLLSIASAKGIEFPIVFVAAVTEHHFPSSQADPEGADHARRLLYTAITRAGRHAYVSAPHADASQLLNELDPAHVT
jgi:superfamily I DNA/RNA helicase